MSSTLYVIILDKELGFCRLFREDSPDIPSGEILCSVRGLRRGYDAMMRLNRERRPIVTYHICSRVGAKKHSSYRVMKTVKDGWQSIETYVDYQTARTRLKELAEQRRQAQSAEKAALREIMTRTGMTGRRLPKMTAADIRYIEWLKETGRFHKQAA